MAAPEAILTGIVIVMDPRDVRRRVLRMTRIEIVVWTGVIAVCVGLLLIAPVILVGHAWVGSWFK